MIRRSKKRDASAEGTTVAPEVVPLGELAPDDVLVMEHAGMVVLDGPAALIAQLKAGDLAFLAGSEITPAARVSTAAGQLSSLASRQDTTQVLFQLDENGMRLYRSGALANASAGDGWLRAFSQGGDGLIRGQAAIKPVLLAPGQVLTAQMALTAVALTAAIKSVEQAVERVEQKVGVIADLMTSAQRGAVIGAHESLQRRADQVDEQGVVTETDWPAVAGLGTEVEQQIATLRAFIGTRLKVAEAENAKIGGRRDAIVQVEGISEALALLVVAQHSLFLYQQLRLARIAQVEPQRLGAAVAEVTALLLGHSDADRELLDRTRSVIATRASVRPTEIHRFATANDLESGAVRVDGLLATFADQRSLAYEQIVVADRPGVRDLIDDLKRQSTNAVDAAKRVVHEHRRPAREPSIDSLPAVTSEAPAEQPAEPSSLEAEVSAAPVPVGEPQERPQPSPGTSMG